MDAVPSSSRHVKPRVGEKEDVRGSGNSLVRDNYRARIEREYIEGLFVGQDRIFACRCAVEYRVVNDVVGT